jgi:hypothetical protein
MHKLCVYSTILIVRCYVSCLVSVKAVLPHCCWFFSMVRLKRRGTKRSQPSNRTRGALPPTLFFSLWYLLPLVSSPLITAAQFPQTGPPPFSPPREQVAAPGHRRHETPQPLAPRGPVPLTVHKSVRRVPQRPLYILARCVL